MDLSWMKFKGSFSVAIEKKEREKERAWFNAVNFYFSFLLLFPTYSPFPAFPGTIAVVAVQSLLIGKLMLHILWWGESQKEVQSNIEYKEIQLKLLKTWVRKLEIT